MNNFIIVVFSGCIFIMCPGTTCSTPKALSDIEKHDLIISDSNNNKHEYIVPKEQMITFGDTSTMLMNEDEFWKIIASTRNKDKEHYEGQVISLKLILSGFSTSKIIEFQNTFYTLLNGSYNWNLWGASYVINGGCSDDCFDYFREYLISRGKSRFYSTLKDPDSCADWIKSESQENWQGLSYAASEIYKERIGVDIQLSIPPRKEIQGDPFDESTLNKTYPKLSAKFN